MLDASYGGLDSTQFFVERPENVTAREGEDVLLKCRVGNLQGKVQWTRNGFAMGTYVMYIEAIARSFFRPLVHRD